jgi:hypothetical protein
MEILFVRTIDANRRCTHRAQVSPEMSALHQESHDRVPDRRSPSQSAFFRSNLAIGAGRRCELLESRSCEKLASRGRSAAHNPFRDLSAESS